MGLAEIIVGVYAIFYLVFMVAVVLRLRAKTTAQKGGDVIKNVRWPK